MKRFNKFVAVILSLSLVVAEADLAGRVAYARFIAPRISAKAPVTHVAPLRIAPGQIGSTQLTTTLPSLNAPALPALSVLPTATPKTLSITPSLAATAGAPLAPVADVAASALPQQAATARQGVQPAVLNSLTSGSRSIKETGRDHSATASALGNIYQGQSAQTRGSVAAVAPQAGTVMGSRLNASKDTEETSEKDFEPTAPVTPENNPELFRPESSRVGIGPIKYVWWNAGYKIMQWFNIKLARDPNRRVSWDKWPTYIGLIYLLAKMRWLRSDTLTDPYDYATNDNEPAGKMPERAKVGYEPDGKWAADNENPQMGEKDTRIASNIPPKLTRPDVPNMMRELRNIARLKWRPIDEDTGKEIVTPAGILNILAQAWIQFQFHNFGGNTKRDDIKENPHVLKTNEKDEWDEDEMVVDRTSKDHTRVTDNGRATPLSERTHHWIQAQIYGSDEAELAALRSYENGQMRLDENGMLPEDPEKPGIDQTGFNNNYNAQLGFLHWIFVKEHNAIADHYRNFHPDWDDEKLFLMARKANVAQIARIHTVEWTIDLLQHPTLQIGMHADWYGFVGQKLKMYVMRLSARHPWVGRLLKPITNNDTIWGMPGSRWEHHDGPYAVPKQFRMVYRLHELILGEHEIVEPGSDRVIDRIELLKIVHENTRPVIEKFGYDVLGYSFAKKSAGALVLHNFPRALTQFENQQNGQVIDLAMLDLLRERTDGTGTYNEFRVSVGEPPVTSFLELTGGDAELAKEISIKYQGDIDAVDAGIGILAEPRPAGFALTFTQFYQFILNAPRRVKSNRHLTQNFTYKDYQEGMDWVEHGGGMLGAMARHLGDLPHGKNILAAMEGVVRPFTPWKDTETFPARLLSEAEGKNAAIVQANMRTLAFGAAATGLAFYFGALSPLAAIAIGIGLALPVTQFFKRMLAWRYMQKVWQRAYTDVRSMMFPTLYQGVKWSHRSVALGRLTSLATVAGAGAMAWTLGMANPVTAGLFLLTGLQAALTLGKLKAWRSTMELLKISLLGRIRQGAPQTALADLPGDTAIAKRYWFLSNNGKPVATFANSYRQMKANGLPPFKAFMTAALSHLMFGKKTQRGMSWKERGAKGIARFRLFFNDIYIPNLIKAQGHSSSRIFAPEGNSKGLTPGDLDMEEFERMFNRFAPGRDYMTAYDMSRMREGNRVRDAQEGHGNWLTRKLGELAAKRRAEQLMSLFADMSVMEDNHLVPAISRDMLLRFYQGTAQYDLLRERQAGREHNELSAAQPRESGA
jgi:hypothetical protein